MPKISFNTKAILKAKEEFRKKTDVVLERIAPTVFDTEVTVDDKPVTSLFNLISSTYQITKRVVIGREYVMLGVDFLAHKHTLSRNAQIIIDYICLNIEWVTNIINFSENDIMTYHKMDRNAFYNALNELCYNNVIRKTTKKSIYVVNHNYIFKGSLSDFVELYRSIYNTPAKVNADGKIILED